ncbi:MAG TPA: carboxypeptidase-like regulatory domain-containing protein [Candidatus Hydrogenedentes bacterium]|nr:carboxypeptidase regulatory-like domain-containing protein [Candidatus Hydrogenedentota bacterium]HOJ68497.1 carboxypeptidase-like regulatory domain-containing protein [Candidatus Hydrogenedentota bacterium]HOK88807.1 carboxypeptidase-like regulatory domain-containing protein [Candidatus Hydrogenedentota bacterium]
MQRTGGIIRLTAWIVPVIAGVLCGVTGCAGYPGMFIEGKVEDWLGQPLPGVAVTVAGEDPARSGLSDPLGRYRLGATRCPGKIVFMKSGYTRVILPISSDLGTIWNRVAEVPRLWPVPSVEGVYLAEKGHYRPLDVARPAVFMVRDVGPTPALTVVPSILFPKPVFSGGPDAFPDPASDRFLVAARMPMRETRLWRLRRALAAPSDALSARKRAGVKTTTSGNTAAEKRQAEETYYQAVWVADARVSITLRPVDDPDGTLYVIVPDTQLSPGVYAVHWGGITGTGALEQRVYLFAVPDPATGAIPEPEKTEEERQRDEKREQQRQQRRKEMDKSTNEGMG